MGARDSRNMNNFQSEKTLKSIHTQIKAELAQPQRRINILLLGTSGTGKSTLLKQVKIIFNGGYTNDESQSFKPLIVRNLVESLLRLVRLMNSQEIAFETNENEMNAKMLMEIELDDYDHRSMMGLDKQLSKMMRSLWNDNKLKIFHSYSFECQQKDTAN